MLTKFRLVRIFQTEETTYGLWLGESDVLAAILERGGAVPEHPRIPAGEYPIRVKPRGTSKFDAPALNPAFMGGDHHGMLQICEVPDRDQILVHWGNTFHDSLGCLLAGRRVVPTARGYEVPGTESKPAYKALYRAVYPIAAAGEAVLQVIDQF